MHIGFVIFRGEPTRGGAERYVDTLGRALVARGHRVSVLAAKHGDVSPAVPVKIRANGVSRTSRYRSFLTNLELHLARERYDIVHACLPVKHCDVYHAHAGLETLSLRDGHLGRPTLSSQLATLMANKMNRKRRTFARVEAMLLGGPKPPITICLSKRERDEAARLFPSADTRLVTLHSAPDDARFAADKLPDRRAAMRKQLGLTDDQTMFLFVGQDFDRKGLAIAIRALGKLTSPDAVLYVIGDGDVHRFSQIALRANALGRVLFVGPTSDVAGFLAAADALVLPSRHEPFGMVVIEAMLMGVPPIVSAIAGASEVVQEGKTGHVIDHLGDIDAWARAMKSIADRGTHDAMSAACLALRPQFSYTAHVDAIEAIYRRVAAEPR